MNLPISAMPWPRPTDEYGPTSPRSVNLRQWREQGITVKDLGKAWGLEERQAGYILAIRDALIREETTDGGEAENESRLPLPLSFDNSDCINRE